MKQDGYIAIYSPRHPHRTKKGYVREHILIAEQVLGRLLPEKAVVHHHNENRAENKHTNLVICENESYHKHLHIRMRALRATGNPRLRKCKICKEWDIPENLMVDEWRRYHARCHSARQRLYRQRKVDGELSAL